MKTNNIAALLKDRRMSQGELAAAIGISQPHVARLISGETRLRPDHIKRIAKALECSELEISNEYTPPLSALTRQMVLGFEKLTAAQQEAYVRQINSIIEPEAVPSTGRQVG